MGRIFININGLFLSIIFSIIYFFISVYYAFTVEIKGDILEYLYNYLNIRSEPFPLPMEYVTFIIMNFCELIGLDFRSYLIVNYLLWLPFLSILIYRFKNDFFIYCIVLFFLTVFFFDNASYLIRQYNALIFFLYGFFIKNKKIKYFLYAISFFSHISSLFLIIFSNVKVSFFVFKVRFVFLIFTFLALYFPIGELIFSFLTDFMGSIGYDVLLRKNQGLIFSGDLVVNNIFIYLNYALLVLVCFIWRYGINSFENNKILSLIVFSCFCYLIFSDNLILANRIGFLSFLFIIPLILIVLRGIYFAKFK